MDNCTSQGHICMKRCPKWWLHIGFPLQGKLSTCLKIFRSFGTAQHIGKNDKSKWKHRIHSI